MKMLFLPGVGEMRISLHLDILLDLIFGLGLMEEVRRRLVLEKFPVGNG